MLHQSQIFSSTNDLLLQVYVDMVSAGWFIPWKKFQVAIHDELKTFLYLSNQLCSLSGLGMPIVSGNSTQIHSDNTNVNQSMESAEITTPGRQ